MVRACKNFKCSRVVLKSLYPVEHSLVINKARGMERQNCYLGLLFDCVIAQCAKDRVIFSGQKLSDQK